MQILIYTIEIVAAAHRLQAIASQHRWNDVDNEVYHYLMAISLLGTLTAITQLRAFWNVLLKYYQQHITCKLWNHNRQAMTSKINYPTIWWPLIYSGLTHSYHNSVHFEIYDWNSASSTSLASYGITTEKEWRRKSSIPLLDGHCFIRNSHPHTTTAYILQYTIEIVAAAFCLQAIASQHRWNDVENEVYHYLMAIYLFGTPTLIEQLCTFWNIRLK